MTNDENDEKKTTTKLEKRKEYTFPSDIFKIPYVVGLLWGRALSWAEALSSNLNLATLSFERFVEKLKLVFDHPDYVAASTHLAGLRQGNCSVANYSLEFWTLAADAQWKDAALRSVFFRGLNGQLKEELVSRDEPHSSRFPSYQDWQSPT